MIPQNTIFKMEKMTERDIPELVRIFEKDASISEGLELSRKDRRNLEEYFYRMLDAVAEGRRISFVLRSIAHRGVIGGISFIREDFSSIWERSFWIVSEAREKGIASQATSSATAWMFDNGLASEIREMTRAENKASLRLKEKQGFRLNDIMSSGAGEWRLDVLHPSSFIPQHI